MASGASNNPSVFPGHFSKDKAFVRTPAEQLKCSGVSFWLDEAGMLPCSPALEARNIRLDVVGALA